jgi:hypothetical protein
MMKLSRDANALKANQFYAAEIAATNALKAAGGLASNKTLRDEFAMAALTGILAGGFADTVPHDSVHHEADFYAYKYADEMLEARKTPEGDV